MSTLKWQWTVVATPDEWGGGYCVYHKDFPEGSIFGPDTPNTGYTAHCGSARVLAGFKEWLESQPTLEYRDGEYVHFRNRNDDESVGVVYECLDGTWYVTANETLGGYWIGHDIPASLVERWITFGHPIISHGFLTGTVSVTQPPEPLKVPKADDFITVTHRDGSTHTGVLTRSMTPGAYMGVELDGVWAGYMRSKEEEEKYGTFENDVVKWCESQPPEPTEPTEFGAMVRVDGVEYVRVLYGHLNPWYANTPINGRRWNRWVEITSRGPVEVLR